MGKPLGAVGRYNNLYYLEPRTQPNVAMFTLMLNLNPCVQYRVQLFS